jgi:succinate-semialdehyde dehydrogenase/glutarate-semialdehyde dehydrogenase
MTLVATNPYTGEQIATFEEASDADVQRALDGSQKAFAEWRKRPVAERAALFGKLAETLRANKPSLAALATLEMGKPITEAEGEVEKSAWFCDYYAENAERFLAPETIAAGSDANYVRYEPLGAILAVMPWNFPYVQVFRFAPPALVAGNVAVLKHASNVPQCAIAIERMFLEAGFPEGVFTTLLSGPKIVDDLLSDTRIGGVALTGSDRAGSSVASIAGRELKTSVMELGGSDPFIVLDDADIAEAAKQGCRGRNINAGQACIASKRFIVLEDVADEFEAALAREVESLKLGDPLDTSTQVGPLARPDLVEALESQVQDSVAAGAKVVAGGTKWDGPGFFAVPTVLTDVTPEMRVFREETFGPVAAVVRARDEEEAIALANDTQFGLGASIWTRDTERGKRVAEQVEAGMVFVNAIVISDPRLPFGGTKRSGYGRELGEHGIREFTYVKSVAVHEAAEAAAQPVAAGATE